MTTITKIARVRIAANPHIYILKDVGNKALKIGFSINHDQRFVSHNTANPFLKLIVTIPVNDQTVESKLHKQMIPFRAPETREWYVDSLLFRNVLDVFFVLQGVVSDSIVELTTKFLPDADDLFNSYIASNMTAYYREQLAIQAWLEEKPMAEVAGDAIASGLDKRQQFTENALLHIARNLGLSVDNLKAGILNGTIAPLSCH